MKILFVDDEVQVLKGLRRMLATMEDEWDTEFATSGTEALHTLSEDAFDVLVTDMRMPGMDGAELLKCVSKDHPEVVRIILSGQASRESVFRAVSPMHQYLSKPCDAETLRSTVSRACALRDALQSDSLQQLVSQITTLPSLPSLYQDVVDEVQSPDGSIKRVGEIVSQDPGMTVKILQIANSSLFGLRASVFSPVQAVSLLGMEAIQSLVLSIGVFQQFNGKTLPGVSIESLFERCVAVGGCARLIAKAEKCDESVVDCAFTAGMLQDIGRLVLAMGMPEQYTVVLKQVDTQRPLSNVEFDILGATHAFVGAYLLELWGMPQPMAETVAFHESPEDSHDVSFTALTALVAANRLSTIGTASSSTAEEESFHRYIDKIGMSHRLPVWREICLSTQEQDQ